MIKKEEGFAGQRSYKLSPTVLKSVTDHPLCQRLYITSIGLYPKAAFHARKRKKGCNQHILIYCVQGEGWYEIQGERHPIKPNQAILLPAHVPHQYGADIQKPWTIYWLHFTGDYAGVFLNYLCPQNQFLPLDLPPDPKRIVLFEDIFNRLTMADNLDNLVYANSCFYHFLATLKSPVYKQKTGEALKEMDAVELAITFMKAHLNKNLSLRELAGQAGMSASHFSALFRKKTNNSPVNFFTCLRVQKACELLENSRLKIKDIAHQVGFHDPYHFTRVFTQVTGHPPKKFRSLEKAGTGR
jgi:AraC family transcriptional regulator, arabinose operon regulatory protein